MLRIKICGITRPEDAQAAAAAGADAIGLVCVPGSPRFVDLSQAKAVMAALPPLVTPVGVFMDTVAEVILEVAAVLGIGTVQLHGEEPVDSVEALRPLAVIKALHVRESSVYGQIQEWTRAGVHGLLLDKPRTAARSDPAPMAWHLLTPAAIREHCGQAAPILLAGGLTPDNVGDAVRTVQPYGVDVASGVEIRAGMKNHDLIKDFVSAARRAADRSPEDGAGTA